jgi:hypothetical protein
MTFTNITSSNMELRDERGRPFMIVNPLERAKMHAKIEDLRIAEDFQRIREHIHALKVRRLENEQLKDAIEREQDRLDADEAAETQQ